MNTESPPLFIADCHLGKLAKYLRVMGIDTLYFSSIGDNDLIELAKKEGRVILTRDKILHERKKAPSFHLESIEILEQLRALQKTFFIKNYKLHARCIVCNTPLHSIEKSEIDERIPKKVKHYFEEFEICDTCNRIYWKGDHYKRMMALVDSI